MINIDKKKVKTNINIKQRLDGSIHTVKFDDVGILNRKAQSNNERERGVHELQSKERKEELWGSVRVSKTDPNGHFWQKSTQGSKKTEKQSSKSD